MQVSCGKKVQFKACFPFCKGKQTLDSEDDDEQAESQTGQKHQNVETKQFGYPPPNPFVSANPFVGNMFASPNPFVNFNPFANYITYAKFNPYPNPSPYPNPNPYNVFNPFGR